MFTVWDAHVTRDFNGIMNDKQADQKIYYCVSQPNAW
jgi:hypothetical protein